jgi:hypothetical protein
MPGECLTAIKWRIVYPGRAGVPDRHPVTEYTAYALFADSINGLGLVVDRSRRTD